MNPWQPYVDSVLNGTRLCGRLERLSVERSVRLWNDPKYEFDEEDANWAIETISSFRMTKGERTGECLALFGWQKFWLAHVFGLKYKGEDRRVVTKALLCIAKKGGKSEFAAAVGVLMCFLEGENVAEGYTVANKREQAKYSFDSAKGFTKYAQAEGGLPDIRVYDSQQSYELVSKIKNSERDPDGSFFRAIASDSGTLDGCFPHFGLVDEYHEAPDSTIPDNLESGMVSRKQPLLLIITTRGFNYKGVLWQLEQKYELILTGVVENDSIFPLIFALDEGDDWEDEKMWEKANPGIGVAPTWEGLRSQYRSAKTEGQSKLVSFKTKNLNIWEKTARTWVPLHIMKKGSSRFDEKMLVGRTCYGGLDLAQVRDLAAWTMLFPPTEDDPVFRLICRTYCPEERVLKRTKEEQVPYADWAADGWLNATPGNVIDYKYIGADIRRDAQTFDLVHAYYDRYNSSDLVISLQEDGINLESFAQTTVNFNAPIVSLELDIVQGQFNYGDNPVVEWAFQNVQIKMDAGGNMRFDKANSKDKIDPAVATAMSRASFMNAPEPEPEAANEIIIF